MVKQQYIWKLTKAGYNKYHKDYSLGTMKAKSEYYSSLRKMRRIVKETVESGEIGSYKNWTEEEWDKDGNYCVVINSGGCSIFSFKKIIIK